MALDLTDCHMHPFRHTNTDSTLVLGSVRYDCIGAFFYQKKKVFEFLNEICAIPCQQAYSLDVFAHIIRHTAAYS